MHIILNCTKETNLKISGTYKLLETEGKFREQTFCKLDKSLFIYKTKKKQYVVSTRLYSKSFRAYVKSDSLFIKDSWYIYHGNSLWIPDNIAVIECKNFVYNENIPSNTLVIYSKYNNIQGGYKKLPANKHNTIAYYNEEDQKYLYKIKTLFSQYWVIGNTLGSYNFFFKSDNWEELPEYSNFTSSGIVIKPFVESELYNNICEDKSFVDLDFDANYKSIGENMNKFENISWIRAVNLQPMFSKMVLFHDIEPNDIMQGCIGDCWLMAALSSIAEFPKHFKKKIFKTQTVSKIGKYQINLFDCSKNKWTTITIDDRIPCREQKKYESPKPLFSQPHENEMYILLLEKAFAKQSGSYTKLDGGFPAIAWMVLTGCKNVEYWKKQNSIWNKSMISGNKSDPWNFQKINGYKTQHNCVSDSMFAYLKECDKKNYLMSAAIHGNIMEKKRNDGLIERHAYSLLKVFQKNTIKLVCLRNPWSRGESNLDWSDKSLKWTEFPDIAKDLKYTNDNDGKFWITWEDFSKIFDEVEIACVSMC